MTPLRVLLPLALLVAVTLAAFPSSNQIRNYGKESSGEDDILLPGNPAIENIFPKTVNSDNLTKLDGNGATDTKNPSESEKKGEDKTPDVENPSKDEKKGEDKTPDVKNPSKDEKKDENKTPSDGEKKSDDDKASEVADYRLPTYIVPTHYTIDLTVDQFELPAKISNYTGTVGITFETTQKTRTVKFHYDRKLIELDNVTLIETNKGRVIGVEEKKETNLDVAICELNVKEDLNVQTSYTLTLVYKGRVNDKSRGFYKGSYLNNDGERRWYAVTHFEPMGARSAFPCLDEPALKATFKITITHRSDYDAISNMPVEDIKDLSKEWKQVTFKTTPKMSTYLVAFAITDFGHTGTDVKVYSRKEVVNMGKYAAEVGDKVLKLLEEFTGVSYDLKMDQIALPLLQPGAMENWGLVTYRETALLYDKDLNATIDQQKVASIIAHEFAHQWFGNLVSPKWWEYIWLNEGFATYFQYYIADKINPNWRFMEQFNSAALQGTAFPYDADLTKTRPMDHDVSKEKDIGDLFDSIAYQKAGSVIRMFAHVLGEKNFKKSLKTYLTNKKYDAATSADLFKEFDEVVDKKSLPEGVTVTQIFEKWAKQKGYPVITVTKNNDSLVIKQEPFYFVKATGADESSWYVPLNFALDSEKPDFDDTSVTHWLEPNKAQLKISVNTTGNLWVIFNKQQTGYYRVNYDEKHWNAIADYLKGDNYTKIHPLNRAQLIDDALNLAKANKLKYSVALNLLDYLYQETDYIVWKSVFGVLSTLNKLLATTEYYGEFSKYLVTLTETLLETVKLYGNETEPYDTKLLRVDALKWACNSGSEVCRTHASVQVKAWLEGDNKNATLSRDLGKVLLCGAVRNASFEEWNRLFVKYVTSTNTDEKELILSALGCSLSPDTLEYFLNLAVQPDSIFAGRVLQIFQGVYTNSPVGVAVALDFVSKNLHKLMTYDSKFDENIEKYINELGSRIARKEDVQKLTDLIEKLGLPVDKTKKALDIATYNSKWLEQNSKEINGFFVEKNTVTEPPPLPVTTKKGNGAGSLSFTTLLLAAPIALLRLR